MDSTPGRRALRVAASLANEIAEITRDPAPRPTLSLVSRSAKTTDAVKAYDAVIDDPELVATTRELFCNGHLAQCVEEAFKYTNNLVKQRTGLMADGADLMNRALSPKNPVLKLSSLKTASQQDQQQGYMQILAGVMTGVRNPRAHQHRYLEDPRVALELLCLANHLSRVIRKATRTRRKKSP